MARIKLTGKYAVGQYEYALVDDDMLEDLSKWRWKAKPNGSGSGIYAVRNAVVSGKNATIRMHRVVMGMDQTDPLEVDHCNHNTVDNRRANLSRVTRRVNALNYQTLTRTACCKRCEATFTRTVIVSHQNTAMSCDDCIRERDRPLQKHAVYFPSCRECSKTFTARRKGNVFCGPACRYRHRDRASGSSGALSDARGLRARDLSVAKKF
jgi:hypothetical protein